MSREYYADPRRPPEGTCTLGAEVVQPDPEDRGPLAGTPPLTGDHPRTACPRRARW